MSVSWLLINGENDTEEEMAEMADFIAGVSPEIPLHISRFFPAQNMKDAPPTDIRTMERFREIAESKLSHVFLGNV